MGTGSAGARITGWSLQLSSAACIIGSGTIENTIDHGCLWMLQLKGTLDQAELLVLWIGNLGK